MCLHRLSVLLLLIFHLFYTASAQNEIKHWYFGNNAGLDFSSGTPEPLIDGNMRAYEGCASVSNAAGELLFYTNGVSVWNARHDLMENGNDLLGDTSATQSALIVPHPGNADLYYIFTIDVLDFVNNEIVTDGLRYSMVNLSHDDGYGAITQKNILLRDSVPEKITAVRKGQENAYWVVSHEWGTNQFLAWLIDEDGLHTEPVVSAAGTPHVQIQDHNIINSIGNMKISPQGDRLALALLRASLAEVFIFDNATGEVSDVISIPFEFEAVYGVEFSPDGSKLYITSIRSLYQVDLEAGTPDDIIASLTEVYEESYYMGSMQIGNDGKIYCSVDESDHLGIIHSPNKLTPECNYESEAIYLEGRQSRLGLPNFPVSLFLPPDFYVYPTCYGTESFFFPADTVGLDSVIWNFGDPASGSNNTSSAFYPFHLYENTGSYTVEMTTWQNGVSTLSTHIIEIEYGFEFDLGADTVICGETSYLMRLREEGRVYAWFDNSDDSEYLFTEDGLYWAEVVSEYTGCKNFDTIRIDFSPLPPVELGSDSFFCSNEYSYLEPEIQCDTCDYLWSTGENTPTVVLTEGGFYWLQITNGEGCFDADTVWYERRNPPAFDLGTDTTLCDDDYMVAAVDFWDATYQWQDGSDDSDFVIAEAGLYTVTAENDCGLYSDSLRVEYKYCGPIVIPNIITPNQDGVNDIFFIKGITDLPWQLKVFSRWGNTVYLSSDYQNDWQPNKLSEGVYYYILSCAEIAAVYKGFFHIVR